MKLTLTVDVPEDDTLYVMAMARDGDAAGLTEYLECAVYHGVEPELRVS